MFSEEQMKQYMSVKAPEELKANVMSAVTERETYADKSRTGTGDRAPDMQAYDRKKNIRREYAGLPYALRGIATLAAGFVLIAASVVALSRIGGTSATLSVREQIISQNSKQVAFQMTREAMVSETNVGLSGLELELDTAVLVTLSVTSGTLYLVDEETEEMIASGTVCGTDHSCIVYWELQGTEERCELTLSETKGGSDVYILTQREDGWQIYLK